jgi:hypothetical protein
MPSAQLPERQSSFSAQLPPLPCFGSQTPVLQTSPAMQSLLVTQLVPQTVPLQMYSPQEEVVVAPHCPAPSQVAAVVATPKEQVAAWHTLLLAGKVQLLPFTPLQ